MACIRSCGMAPSSKAPAAEMEADWAAADVPATKVATEGSTEGAGETSGEGAGELEGSLEGAAVLLADGSGEELGSAPRVAAGPSSEVTMRAICRKTRPLNPSRFIDRYSRLPGRPG